MMVRKKGRKSKEDKQEVSELDEVEEEQRHDAPDGGDAATDATSRHIASWIAVLTSNSTEQEKSQALATLHECGYVFEKSLAKGICAARLGFFDVALKLLQASDTSEALRYQLWNTPSSIMFMNPAAQRHIIELLDPYLALVQRDWARFSDAIAFFLNQVAEISAALPFLYRHVIKNSSLLQKIAILSQGEFIEKVAASARVLKDLRTLAAIREAVDAIGSLEVLVIEADEASKGSWDIAILEIFGAVEDHPLVRGLLDGGIVEGYLRMMCNIALVNGEYPPRNHYYDMINLEVMVNMSTVESTALRMIVAGYLDICVRALQTPLSEDRLEPILKGQAACLEVMGNIARFAALRPQVQKALESIATVDGSSGSQLLERMRNSSEARIRAAAQRLLFEVGWLEVLNEDVDTTSRLPAEVLARGVEAEAIYRKALEGGQGRVRSVKMVLLGEDRSGKSSVLASVSGAGWDPKMESTHGVATSHFKLPRHGAWKTELGGLTAAEATASVVASELRDPKSQNCEESDNEQEGRAPKEVALPKESTDAKVGDNSGEGADFGNQSPQIRPEGIAPIGSKVPSWSQPGRLPIAGTEQQHDENVATVAEVSDIPLDLIALALQEDTTSTRVVVKDTAGQPRYHGMLARALSSSSIPIVVFSLERWAKNVLKHSAFQDHELDMELHCPTRAAGDHEEESTLGHEERLFCYWFSMIQVRTKDTSSIIVGTHLDKVTSVLKGDSTAIDELLQKIHERIDDLLMSIGVVDRILPSSSRDLLYFAVDNSRFVPQHGIDDLQAAIREAVSDVQTIGPLSQKIPLVWVRLLDALKAMGRPYLSIADVCHVAKHFGLSSTLAGCDPDELDKEVRSALRFLHDIGEILYFAEAGGLCSDIVFADAEFLSLAEANILDCPRTIKNMNKLATLLHRSAILDEALLPLLWENLLKMEAKAQPRSVHEPIDFKQVMLDFLVADGFLVPLQRSQPVEASAGNRRYLVPSLLQRWTLQSEAAPSLTALAKMPPREACVSMDLRELSLPELFPQFLSRLLQHPGFPPFKGELKVLFRNAIQMPLPSCTVSILEVPLGRPTEVLAHVEHFVSTPEIQSVSHILQTLAGVLEDTGRRIAAKFADQVVVGPVVELPDSSRVVVSLKEVLRSVERDGAVKCAQVPGIVPIPSLPAWVPELLPSKYAEIHRKAQQEAPKEISAKPQTDAKTLGLLDTGDKADGPAHNAITVSQLMSLVQQTARDFPEDGKALTMYDINERIILPACAKHKRPYARVLNDPEPKMVQVFITHAWRENFNEFAQSVEHCFMHEPDKPNIWICAFALYQSADRSAVSAQLGNDPAKAPFTEALKRAERYLVVRNRAVDIFARIWCCWELYCADKYGLLEQGKGKFLITGPCCFPCTASEDVAKAEATDPEDKRVILFAITSEKIYHTINERVRQIKGFAVDESQQGDKEEASNAAPSPRPTSPAPVIPVNQSQTTGKSGGSKSCVLL